MMHDLQQQKYTCQTNERSYILQMSKKELNSIGESGLKEEFTSRLAFLQSCQLFNQVTLFTLLPIANNLVEKKFKLGEFILNAGEVPTGLYLIKKGFCRVGLPEIKFGNH